MTDISDEASLAAETLRAAIRSMREPGVGRTTTKQVFDVQLMSFADLFCALAPHERVIVSGVVDEEDAHDPMDESSRRVCAFAIRERQAEHLRRAAALIACENCQYDTRETLRSLSVLHYSWVALGRPAPDPVQTTAELSQPDLAYMVTQFRGRREDTKGLSVLGMTTVETPNGVWFESARWTPPETSIRQAPMKTAAFDGESSMTRTRSATMTGTSEEASFAATTLRAAIRSMRETGVVRSMKKEGVDIHIMLFADLFYALAPQERVAVSKVVDEEDVHDMIDAASRRVCAFAIRDRQALHLRRAAALIACENCGYDPRETVRSLGVLHYSWGVLGRPDPNPVQVAAELSQPELAYLVTQFEGRPEDMKELEVLGVVATETEFGTWFSTTFHEFGQ